MPSLDDHVSNTGLTVSLRQIVHKADGLTATEPCLTFIFKDEGGFYELFGKSMMPGLAVVMVLQSSTDGVPARVQATSVAVALDSEI